MAKAIIINNESRAKKPMDPMDRFTYREFVFDNTVMNWLARSDA